MYNQEMLKTVVTFWADTVLKFIISLSYSLRYNRMLNPWHKAIGINVTGFVKNGLISGVHNCSYSPFSSAKAIFVDFRFSSKIKI